MRASIDVLFPDPCGLCGLRSPDATLCPACSADLPWIQNGCPRCGVPQRSGLCPAPPCADCQRKPPPFVRAFAPLAYAFPVDAMIKSLKFRRRTELARPLADCALPWLMRHREEFDALVPVPLHRLRNASRGFNQAEELALRLKRESGVPIRHYLHRVKRTQTQSGLDARERQKNLRDAFRVSTALNCQHALVVDDVITTTATVREVCKALLFAGAKRVSVLAIARASGSAQTMGDSNV